MTTLNILFLGISLFMGAPQSDLHIDLQEGDKPQAKVYLGDDHSMSSLKTDAFQVLTHKCNVCHSKQNRKRVFTLTNMDLWADDIYKQVFIKKRMPRGNKIKLNQKESEQLLNWITSLKKQ